jgi:hypothetical protein
MTNKKDKTNGEIIIEELDKWLYDHCIGENTHQSVLEDFATSLLPKLNIPEEGKVKELEFKNKVLIEGIKAYKKLNMCYRLGGQPPEWVFKAIEKLDKFIKDI